MENQKKQAIIKLVETINILDLSSINLLNFGADMLKAKEATDKRDVREMQEPDPRKAG